MCWSRGDAAKDPIESVRKFILSKKKNKTKNIKPLQHWQLLQAVLQADKDSGRSGGRLERSQFLVKNEFSVTMKLTQTSFVLEKEANGNRYLHSWSSHDPAPLWIAILRTIRSRNSWPLGAPPALKHRPSYDAFPLPCSPHTDVSIPPDSVWYQSSCFPWHFSDKQLQWWTW